MPKSWYDWHEANYIANPVTRELYRDIVASRKPYFMIYIYPAMKKQYRDYINKSNKNSVRKYGMTISEMESSVYSELTEEQREFLRFYDFCLPVSNYNGVMNRICRKFEEEFDGYIGKHQPRTPFDYTIMKSDAEYTQYQYNCIANIYAEYNKMLQEAAVESSRRRVGDSEHAARVIYRTWLSNECFKICPNEDSLCNLLLDMCYKKSSMKHLVWDLCSDVIVRNLLKNNGYTMQYPELNPRGDIRYCGERFRMRTVRKDEVYESCNE